jgi:hypothetical protein
VPVVTVVPVVGVAAFFDEAGLLGVFGGLFELPQPAISATQATAIAHDEYSFRVMVPPFWVRVIQLGPLSSLNLDDQTSGAQDSRQIAGSGARTRGTERQTTNRHELPEPMTPRRRAVNPLKRRILVPIFNG